MALYYGTQISKFLFGSETTTVTLTTSYINNVASVDSKHFSELTAFVDYTPGAGGGGNSIQIKFEGSADDALNSSSSFNQETFSSIAGGTMTHTLGEHTFVGSVAGTTYKFKLLNPPADLQTQISIKETVVGGAAGTAKLRILLSGV